MGVTSSALPGVLRRVGRQGRMPGACMSGRGGVERRRLDLNMAQFGSTWAWDQLGLGSVAWQDVLSKNGCEVRERLQRFDLDLNLVALGRRELRRGVRPCRWGTR